MWLLALTQVEACDHECSTGQGLRSWAQHRLRCEIMCIVKWLKKIVPQHLLLAVLTGAIAEIHLMISKTSHRWAAGISTAPLCKQCPRHSG